jgi:hypothetical protein
MSKTYYISNSKITCAVDVDDNDNVIATPPILKKFIGQPFENVKIWMRGQGPIVVNILE